MRAGAFLTQLHAACAGSHELIEELLFVPVGRPVVATHARAVGASDHAIGFEWEFASGEVDSQTHALAYGSLGSASQGEAGAAHLEGMCAEGEVLGLHLNTKVHLNATAIVLGRRTIDDA